MLFCRRGRPVFSGCDPRVSPGVVPPIHPALSRGRYCPDDHMKMVRWWTPSFLED